MVTYIKAALIFIGIIFVLTPIMAWIESYSDAIRAKKKEIEHKRSFVIRILFAVITAHVFHLKVVPMINTTDAYFSSMASMLAAIGVAYWLIFDIGFNYHSKRPVLAIGSTSKIDRFTKKYFSEGAMFLIKIILFLSIFYLELTQISNF